MTLLLNVPHQCIIITTTEPFMFSHLPQLGENVNPATQSLEVKCEVAVHWNYTVEEFACRPFLV